jgi:hypothetical protein
MKLYQSITILAALAFTHSACVKDLDALPIDPLVVTSESVYNNDDAYIQALAKIYAGLAITGQQGPAGNSDLNVNDEGFTSYLRLFWNAQELPTDEAVNSWGDVGLPDFHNQNWSSSNNFTRYLYDRIFYQVSLANEYIRQVTPRVSGLSAEMQTEVKYFLAEARFMRALSYYHAMDLYGNVPFVTEADAVGSFLPQQISRAALFDYIETELNAIVDDNNDIHLKAANTNDYGRADKGAAYALLARMYLNHHVYLGKVDATYYTKCITSCKSVMDAGYSLNGSYAQLFMADNNLRDNDIIFSINFDGLHTQSWGGMTFIVSAAIGGTMSPADFGSNQKWGGNRVTSALVKKFDTGDTRAMFYTSGQKLEISDIKNFSEGYAVTKFTNKKSDGTNGSHLTYVDTDFPLFRISDIYLMYAEAILRGGTGGDNQLALSKLNDIRTRVSASTISAAQMTLDYILDERARELFWECTRRTDLIRYGRFSESTYVWPWKGGVKDGASTGKYLNVYPIPSSDLSANPNLKQNDQY